MKRPMLTQIPMNADLMTGGGLIVTMRPGQWDQILASSYNAGAVLLEIATVRGKEMPVRAYRKPGNN